MRANGGGFGFGFGFEPTAGGFDGTLGFGLTPGFDAGAKNDGIGTESDVFVGDSEDTGLFEGKGGGPLVGLLGACCDDEPLDLDLGTLGKALVGGGGLKENAFSYNIECRCY